MRSEDTAVNSVPTDHEENKRQGPIGTSCNGEENCKRAGYPEIGIDISFS